MAKYLYLHMGPPKTGTKAIQSFLDSNDQLLSEKGFHYLKTFRDNRDSHRPLTWILYFNHYHTYFNTESIPFVENQDEYWFNFKEEIKNTDNKSIIISSEIFPLLEEDAIDELISLFPPMQVKAILYIRDFRELFLSLTAEIVKNQESSTRDERISQIYDNHIHSFYSFFKRSLELWKDKIGANNIIFRKYGKDYFKNGNIFADFLDVLGLTLTDDFILLDKLKNESLHFCESIYFKDMLNKLTLNTSQRKLIRTIKNWEKENQGTEFFLPNDVALKIENDSSDLHTYLMKNFLDKSYEGFFDRFELPKDTTDFNLSYSDFESILNYLDSNIKNFKNDFVKSLLHALNKTYDYELKCNEFEELFTKSLKNKKAALWGCGDIAERLFNKYSFLRNGNFDIIDKNVDKHGKNFWGHTIMPPSVIINKGLDTVIISSVKYAKEISKEIVKQYSSVKYIFKISDLNIKIGFEPVNVQ